MSDSSVLREQEGGDGMCGDDGHGGVSDSEADSGEVRICGDRLALRDRLNLQTPRDSEMTPFCGLKLLKVNVLRDMRILTFALRAIPSNRLER